MSAIAKLRFDHFDTFALFAISSMYFLLSQLNKAVWTPKFLLEIYYNVYNDLRDEQEIFHHTIC